MSKKIMAKKKTMATTKKKSKKVSKILEFFRAISGFWPVWLSTLVIVGGVFGFQYYESIHSANKEDAEIVSMGEVTILPEQIKIVGNLKYIQPKKIQRLISENISSGLINSNLNTIKVFVESEAWVRSASIKRLPSDILQLQIEEQKPMMRWGNKGLISVNGELFEPKNLIQFSSMPSIFSDKKSIPMGLQVLTKSIVVLKKLKLDLKQINEDKLGAWELQTKQGVLFKFGRKELNHRLQVLEKLWPSAVKKGSLKIVDLRYPNGAAVSYL
jgi:cell division protein FtsQ